MPAFALRFVGQETLPPRLSEFDREQFFELSSADVTAIRVADRDLDAPGDLPDYEPGRAGPPPVVRG